MGSLYEKAPHLEKEWSSRNSVNFKDLSCSLQRKFWWNCSKCSQEWDALLSNRVYKGMGCPFCSGRRVSGRNSLATKAPFLKQQWSPKNTASFEEVAFKSNTKYWWVCENGHEWKSAPCTRTGITSGCPGCSRRITTFSNSLKTLAPHLEKEWSPRNKRAFKDVSIKNGGNFWWVCENGHEWQAIASNRTRSNTGCQECLRLRTSLATKAPWLESEWSTKNTLLFQEVTYGSDIVAIWRCKTCSKEWETQVHNRAINKSGCPYCCRTHTKLEIKLEQLLGVDRFNKTIPGVLTPKGRGYKPDTKLSDTVYANADGLYWHSEEQKGKRYHWDARVAFEKAGLRLLQFWEDEVHDKPEVVKSMVEAVLGTTPTKLHARKCKIIHPAKPQVQDFLDKNHIIGPVHFSKSLGLEHGGELVQVLTYNNTRKGLQITRTATKLHVLVRGGLSKLLEEVKRLEKPGKIITFCDLRYADGHSLTRLGFKHVHTRLNYQYANNSLQRLDKRKFRVPKGVDEAAAAAARGWFRVWGAGLARYEFCAEPESVP